MSKYCSLKAKPRLEVVYTFCTIHVRTVLEMCKDSLVVLKEALAQQLFFFFTHPSVHHY